MRKSRAGSRSAERTSGCFRSAQDPVAEAEGDVVGMGGGDSRRGGQADGAGAGALGVSAGCKQDGGMNSVSILGRLSWPQGRMDWELGSGREGKTSQENL